MKLRQIALLAFLGASLASPVLAQSGTGKGMGPGAGMGKQFNFDNDNTPGWTMMSREERAAHQKSMMDAKTYEECRAAQAANHEIMMGRAMAKGSTLPAPRFNGCDRMRERGFFK